MIYQITFALAAVLPLCAATPATRTPLRNGINSRFAARNGVAPRLNAHRGIPASHPSLRKTRGEIARLGDRLTAMHAKKDSRSTDPEVLNQLTVALERAGFDEKLARTKLEEWKSKGLNNTDQIKGKLVGDTLRSLGIRAGWLAINAYLTYQTYLISQGYEQQQSWLQWPSKFFTILNAYSFSQELLLFGLMSYAVFEFSRNPVLLDAIQEIAGKAELPALEVKPMKVVDGLKVFNTLQELNKKLQDMELEPSPLDTLGSMLTLQRNSDLDAESAPNLDTAAKIFNRYDVNNDQFLDSEELNMMLRDSGLKLEDAEVEEAVKILDAKNNDGRIDFKEFVAFWANRLRRPETKETQQQRLQTNE